nr:putative ammonium transporter 3 [Lytechinus pictus]
MHLPFFILSGAMAERTKLEAYCVFSLVNTLIYCFPAHWIWAKTGIFNQMGAVDIAGAGAVHLVGGITGLTATLMLKPRRGRFSSPRATMEMSNPTNALLGMFMLWWGWLGFNCGSTFGISGGKWKLATRSAIVTVMSGVGGGMLSMICSYIQRPNGHKFELGYLMNGILGGLVAITAQCALARPWEGLLIGAIGGFIAVYTPPLLEKFRIDDPVGVIGVHAVSASWGILAVGMFAQPDDIENLNVRSGLFYGGGWELLGIQALMLVTLIVWTGLTSFILLYAIQITIGLRCSVVEEILGADIIEHGIDQSSPEDRANILRELHSLGKEIPEYLFYNSSGRNWRQSARTLHVGSTTVSRELCDIERRSSIFSLSSTAVERPKENEDIIFPSRNHMELFESNGIGQTMNGNLRRTTSKKYRGKKKLMPLSKGKNRLRSNGSRQKPLELDVSRLEIRDRQTTDVMETVVIETANKLSS